MITLATFGYGMVQKTSTKIKKADIFRQCLLDAQIDLLVDIRYSPWGGYWNPKEIATILHQTPVRYAYKNGEIKLHELLGVPKPQRNIRPHSEFARIYTESLLTRTPPPISALSDLLDKYSPNKVAIMCCEPFVPTRDNCHRFVLADILVSDGIVGEVEHLSMDKTWEKIAMNTKSK